MTRLEELLHDLQETEQKTDERFKVYEAACIVLAEAKALNYDISTNLETGETIVVPLSSIMKDIELESDFEPTGKTKDERADQLRVILMNEDLGYANCVRTLDRAEVEILNATMVQAVAEKDYGRAHTRGFAIRLEIESLLEQGKNERANQQMRVTVIEGQNAAVQNQIEETRGTNLDKEKAVAQMSKDRAAFDNNTALTQEGISHLEEQMAAMKGAYEAKLAAQMTALRPLIDFAKSMGNIIDDGVLDSLIEDTDTSASYGVMDEREG